jgi:glycosyltransferase involved in cell wall biosynthesis
VRVLHIISGLNNGGAEMMLAKLLSATDGERISSAVLSMSPPGRLGDVITSSGVPVFTLDMRPGLRGLVALKRLPRIVRDFAPDLLQGWMYYGNFVAMLSRLYAGGAPGVWNIRQSLEDISREKRYARWAIRLSAFLSSWADAIIYNSISGRVQHEAYGFSTRNGLVIPNGFDLSRFKPSPEARSTLRTELGLESDAQLVGMVARWHPMKDHANFMRAASLILKTHPGVRFVLIGRGMDEHNPELMEIIESLNIGGQVSLLGERADTPVFMAGLDVLVSASAWGEGFPNVLGEAMACGTPCVATNVGDSARVLEEYGGIVPPNDPESLARAVMAYLDLDPASRLEVSNATRGHVKEKYSLSEIAQRYADLYEKIVRSRQ